MARELKTLVVVHCGKISHVRRCDLSWYLGPWDDDIACIAMDSNVQNMIETGMMCMDEITSYYYEYAIDKRIVTCWQDAR